MKLFSIFIAGLSLVAFQNCAPITFAADDVTDQVAAGIGSNSLQSLLGGDGDEGTIHQELRARRILVTPECEEGGVQCSVPSQNIAIVSHIRLQLLPENRLRLVSESCETDDMTFKLSLLGLQGDHFEIRLAFDGLSRPMDSTCSEERNRVAGILADATSLYVTREGADAALDFSNGGERVRFSAESLSTGSLDAITGPYFAMAYGSGSSGMIGEIVNFSIGSGNHFHLSVGSGCKGVEISGQVIATSSSTAGTYSIRLVPILDSATTNLLCIPEDPGVSAEAHDLVKKVLAATTLTVNSDGSLQLSSPNGSVLFYVNGLSTTN